MLRYVKLNTKPVTFELHFAQRAPDPTGGMTVSQLEGYYKEVHATTVRSPYCGFDKWLDNQCVARAFALFRVSRSFSRARALFSCRRRA